MSDLFPNLPEIHKSAIVIDAHSDLLMSIADDITHMGNKLTLPDPNTWIPPLKVNTSNIVESGSLSPTAYTQYFGCAGQYSLPQLRSGGVTLQVFAVYLEDKQLDRALQRGLNLTWWLHQETKTNPDFELVLQYSDITLIKKEGKIGAILSFEGLEPLGSNLNLMDLYYKLGLRMASLTHNRRNLFADGPQPGIKTGGLTSLGQQAVKKMNDLGIVVDLVHTNENCFWEILDLTSSPVVISHLSPYMFGRWRGESWPCPFFNPQKDKQALQAIANKGGVVGMIFFGNKNLNDVVNNIETLIDLIGPNHVGFGSDFYGSQFAPEGLEDISKIPRITDELIHRGYSDEVILKVLGENFLRIFKQTWKI